MRICTFRSSSQGSLSPGLIIDDLVIDLTPVALSIAEVPRDGTGGLTSSAGMAQLVAPEYLGAASQIWDSVAKGASPEFEGEPLTTTPATDVSLGPPIPTPGKIVAAGRNYAAHMDEAQVVWKDRGRVAKPPEYPTGFFKMPSALSGPEDEVPYPNTKEMDYEVELAAVIGSYALNVSPEEALNYVAGYTVMNDLSARDIQFSEMENVGIVVGKNFEGFAPMGPVLVTTDEIRDPQVLPIRLWVNGEIRQDSNTSTMTFSVAECISYFSQMGLQPGDVVMTGSPEGIATSKRPDPTPYYIKPGDVVEAEIEGIGKISNRIVASPAA